MSATTFRVFAAIAGALLGLGAFVLGCQALVLAALLPGYTLVRDPGEAMRQMQSIVLGLL